MRTLRYALILLVVSLCASPVAARFMGYDYLPAERLIQNATAYIAEEPNDPSGYYTLARIHYLAFVNKATLVAAREGYGLPSVMTTWWPEDYLYSIRWHEATRIVLEEFGAASVDEVLAAARQAFWDRVHVVSEDLKAQHWQPEQPTNEQLVAHAGAAQWNFHLAIALDPNNALYYLGQASLGEQYLEFLTEASHALMPAAVREIILNGVKEMYLLTYELSIREDLEREYLPLGGIREIVSYEAGSAFVRLWEADEEIPTETREKIAAIKTNLVTFETLPIGAITPVVLSMEPHSSLADLLAPATVVSFDLDGDGRAERRPWVKPSTGFLVWDGDGDGRISSGREMFGSVTWRLLFANGYRAMDMLDDDRDGWLRSEELHGLSVWFDRNSDGVSDAGELVTTESLGITALAARANGLDGNSPMSTAGLKLKGGRTLPTYDWIAPAAQPVSEVRLQRIDFPHTPAH